MRNHRSLPWRALLGGLLALCAGCGEGEREIRDVKRVEDRLSSRELAEFLAVIDALPDKKLPPLPSILLPAPQWSTNRTLPVNELVAEEVKLLSERTHVDWLAAHFPKSRILERALRRQHMTAEQFVGLALSLGVAQSAREVPSHYELDAILSRGKRMIASLRKDKRVYSSLSEDGTHYIMEQAAWIPVIDRVQRLRLVPPENLSLVAVHAERLRSIYPEEYWTNPLAAFAKLLEDQGTPFEELPESGSDDHIPWSLSTALMGSEGGP